MPEEHTLVGWIPTILGRLSWTKIGALDQRGKTIRIPRGENNYFVVCQTRRVADGIFPRLRSGFRAFWAFLSGMFSTVEREFVGYKFNFYLVVERAADGSTLTGWIACVTAEHDPFRAEFRAATHSAATSANFPELLHKTLQERVRAHNEKVRHDFALRFRSRSVRLMRVVIERDGITRVTRSDEPEVTHEEGERVAQQSFYFMKDVSHIHQHHSESSECQFLLHAESSPTDKKWADEILKDLQRAVITARRSRNNLQDLYDSIGISNYAQTFASICLARTIPLPTLAWDRLANSVHAASAKWTHATVTAERNYTGLVAALALIVALCGSYHILFAAQHTGKEMLTRDVLFPIAFLAHRLFEWDTTSWINKLMTIGLWGGIGLAFVLLVSRTLRSFITTTWHALIDLGVRAQFTSPSALILARVIASVAAGCLIVLAVCVAKQALG